MNMLGKILVMLVFIMSIFFMAFSFMVFMTQTSWKDKAEAETQKLRTQQGANAELENQIKQLEVQRAAANASRTNAIALLEASLATSEGEVANIRKDLSVLKSERQLQGKQVTGSLATLKAERAKVDALRDTVKVAQGERDKIFAEVVDLKNKVFELEAIRQRLTASETSLLDKVARQTEILRANDIKENESISNVPPPRAGRIREVGPNNKMVVVSLGSDDGLKRGHELYVNRGEKYISKILLTKMYPDRAVGRVVDGYQKAAIRRNDNVRTR